MQQVSHGPLSYSVDPLCAMHPMLQGRVATANNTARARNPAGAESTTLHYFYDPSLFYPVAPPPVSLSLPSSRVPLEVYQY